MTNRPALPIIAACLLLLPVLYVASYFALVVPSGIDIFSPEEPGWIVTKSLGRTDY
ncbi:hypothetical protein [Anatilimnocola aggregata]|uniref:hypothetical protein n=1 Tax=Anatilimnocola aggregata TaxID=2528021 RepID=UPI00192E546E|nr:hypothetical protein [Anatilimnocola aggregata]